MQAPFAKANSRIPLTELWLSAVSRNRPPTAKGCPGTSLVIVRVQQPVWTQAQRQERSGSIDGLAVFVLRRSRSPARFGYCSGRNTEPRKNPILQRQPDPQEQ